jgi:tRNA (mo5U34)-methyltransferase
MGLPENLSGKRVLDIGAWHGCLSFECERRGAREVIALGPESPVRTGFNKLKEAIHSKRVQYLLGTVYDLNPRTLGYFDIVLFCGVLYHLRYPTLGIDNIRRVCTGDIYIETVVSDQQLLMKEGEAFRSVPMDEISPELAKTPVWQFYRGGEMNADASNWFGPTCVAVVEAFESAGFTTKLLRRSGRATFYGRLKPGTPEFLTIGSGEGVYYDVITRPLFGEGEEFGMSETNASSLSVQMLTSILASDEYYKKNGNNDEDWIKSLHKRLLGDGVSPVSAEAGSGIKRFVKGLLGQASATKVNGLPARDAFPEAVVYRNAVVGHLIGSKEYQARLLHNYYTSYLGRVPSADEIEGWFETYKRGRCHEFFQATMLGEREYFELQGKSNNEHWLQSVCSTLLGSAPWPEKSSYLAKLAAGAMLRPHVVEAVLRSSQYRQRFMQIECNHLLGRLPSIAEKDQWLGSSRLAA